MLSRLRQMAQQQAEILQTRDEVIGLGLYGSLAYNRVTPFSDLDIFIITTESEHNPNVEHRLRDGIRIDFIWETLEKWQQIQYAPPSYMPWYLVKALLLGTDDMILYDPQGIVRNLCLESHFRLEFKTKSNATNFARKSLMTDG